MPAYIGSNLNATKQTFQLKAFADFSGQLQFFQGFFAFCKKLLRLICELLTKGYELLPTYVPDIFAVISISIASQYTTRDRGLFRI